MLGPIVRAVKGAIPVMLDGGIRRGTDVLKALALGASAVFVGRPICKKYIHPPNMIMYLIHIVILLCCCCCCCYYCSYY